MVLVDVNLLVHAVNADSPDHAAAQGWLDNLLQGTGPVALPWVVLTGFVRITTHPRIMPHPLPLDEALKVMNQWLALPSVTVLLPTIRHAQEFEAACRGATATGNLITDARLAALATEHGAQVASCDADFSKFPGLRWFNPLNPEMSNQLTGENGGN